jgi:hypothetical protein
MSETISEKTHFEQMQEFIGYKTIYISSSYHHYANFSTIPLFHPSLQNHCFTTISYKTPIFVLPSVDQHSHTYKTTGNIGIVPVNS